jgi:hypothetical protein
MRMVYRSALLKNEIMHLKASLVSTLDYFYKRSELLKEFI